ncbi:Septal ring factor EnvC, activator of murein hydrolases AmiA and AmiB [Rhizobiales bacterium GAS191]|jgi:septal ring factor EnvC (AmiA/AmiB activator)|nr:Septal ring factor EnvC, activator of murein hydrolases AmiA and AmiB [Rhizobiales bacterium GAS113]SEC39377.1 Septal ring factor EnvC, activator of murein hydrolases AmiA and AmiB [Rhizobiales bacterium GAS188]SEC88019.1 Septal ring factor EnvC, activator of murein hydrolases AmiA and AmiB [Rhizobiales bacterium GAS191]
MAGADSRKCDGFRRGMVLAALAAICLLLPGGGGPRGLAAEDPGAAQGTSAPVAPGDSAQAGNPVDQRVRQREDHLRELRGIEQLIEESDQERKRIEDEMAAMVAEREKLRRDLVAAADKVRGLEDRASDAEDRLAKEIAQEQALKASLQGRRELIGHVLGALQRIGGKPPPAVIVSAQDILVAVRASIVLGAVLPELREEARTLAADLGELVRLRDAITAERDGLKTDLARLSDERTRLAALVATRQASVAAEEVALGEAGKRAAGLAQRAKSLRDFLAGIDADIAQTEKRAADERKAAEALAASTQSSFTAASLKEPTRLAPKIAFAEARGLLPLPASGSISRDFGDPDEVTGSARGVSIVTRPRAVVSSPSEGVVAHAGPFRGYGQLLIINAGNGYHIVLAGLGHIDVTAGQPVLAGEPIGEMGEGNVLTTDVAKTTSGGPVLYVEFRKDGSAINPGPWWAKTDQRKVRG